MSPKPEITPGFIVFAILARRNQQQGEGPTSVCSGDLETTTFLEVMRLCGWLVAIFGEPPHPKSE